MKDNNKNQENNEEKLLKSELTGKFQHKLTLTQSLYL